jgi:hypothetical protein
MALLAFAAALVAAWLVRQLALGKPRTLQASIAELERDRAALQP